MSEEFIEECWFIYGVKVGGIYIGIPIYHAAGTSGHVEFDWKKAMNPFLLGWIHTHPNDFGSAPSETDNSTMRGWVRGKGKPLLCAILCGNEQTCFEYYRNPDGVISRKWFDLRIFFNIIIGKEEWKHNVNTHSLTLGSHKYENKT
jgi:hypothetical protein